MPPLRIRRKEFYHGKLETIDAAEVVEEKVRIRLPKTKDETGDVFVAVNNRTFLIQRGVEVEVPACVAEVLRNSERATEEGLEYLEQRASKRA